MEPNSLYVLCLIFFCSALRLRFVYAVAYSLLFFVAVYYSIIELHHGLFIYSAINRHLFFVFCFFFQFGVMTNDDAVDFLYMSSCAYMYTFLLEIYLGLSGPIISICSTLPDPVKPFSKVNVQLSPFTSSVESSSFFFTSLPILGNTSSFNFNCTDEHVAVTHCAVLR